MNDKPEAIKCPAFCQCSAHPAPAATSAGTVAQDYYDPGTAEVPPVGHPLRKLGSYLAELLDEDRWAPAEQHLLAAWAGLQSEIATLRAQLAEMTRRRDAVVQEWNKHKQEAWERSEALHLLTEKLAASEARVVNNEAGRRRHPSHVTRSSDASSFDEACIHCGATDISGGGWGELAKPCTAVCRGEDGSMQELWCIHIPGPDDLIAQPSKGAAEDAATKHNAFIRDWYAGPAPGEFSPPMESMLATVTQWPHSVEAHAAALSQPSQPAAQEPTT